MRSKILAQIAVLCVVAILLACGSPLRSAAQARGGALPESYLRRDVGARAIGMGGAYTAIANEPSAIHYNPAGLAFLSERPQVAGMYTFLEFERQHNFLGYSQTFNKVIGVGVAVNNYVAGSFTARNAAGDPLGTYENQQLAAQGSFAVRSNTIALGVTGKYLLNSLKGPNIRGDGWAVDIGMKMQFLDVLSVGLAAQNIAGEMKWNNNAGTIEKMVYTIRAGVAAEFGFNPVVKRKRANILGDVKTVTRPSPSYALIALDALFSENDKRPKIALGGEIAPLEALALRLGFPLFNDDIEGGNFLPFNEFGVGASVRVIDDDLPFMLQIDYAFNKDYIAIDDLSHHLALIVQF